MRLPGGLRINSWIGPTKFLLIFLIIEIPYNSPEFEVLTFMLPKACKAVGPILSPVRHSMGLWEWGKKEYIILAWLDWSPLRLVIVAEISKDFITVIVYVRILMLSVLSLHDCYRSGVLNKSFGSPIIGKKKWVGLIKQVRTRKSYKYEKSFDLIYKYMPMSQRILLWIYW